MLVSPETAVASAITDKITDPRKLGKYSEINFTEKFVLTDNMFIYSIAQQIAKVVMDQPLNLWHHSSHYPTD